MRRIREVLLDFFRKPESFFLVEQFLSHMGKHPEEEAVQQRPWRRSGWLQKRMPHFTKSIPTLSVSVGVGASAGLWFVVLKEFGPGSGTCCHAVNSGTGLLLFMGLSEAAVKPRIPVALCRAHTDVSCLEARAVCVLSNECIKTSLGRGKGSLTRGVAWFGWSFWNSSGQFVIYQV